MTSDDARAILPGWGDLQEELTDSGVKISDKQAQNLLDYLVRYIEDEDDIEEDEELEDEELEDLDDALEDDPRADVDRA